ncbi:PREDICTED: cuticle collagen 13-like [Ceratotherium simum simum]|uniref:Cuticle collagen 13-like n=1 Tax=Ceratotherium simum simum TaxID=73337 RepID=A0ABM1C727_CERSS|nr:PREDICTED: cuticle collagen 13-like [Ceratotherium simum simum]
MMRGPSSESPTLAPSAPCGAGGADRQASQPPPPRPSPQTPAGAQPGLGGRESTPCARGPCDPGERTTVQSTRHHFAQPFRAPLSGAHPIPAAVLSDPGQPHPQAAGEPSRSHAPTCAAAGAARSEGTERPGPSPAPRRVCPCAAAAAAAATAAGWLADWLAARLTPHWGFL